MVSGSSHPWGEVATSAKPNGDRGGLGGSEQRASAKEAARHQSRVAL